MGEQHTKGPWVIRRPIQGDHKGYPYQITSGGSPAQIITSWGGISRRASPEGEANARLIASAPDLLSAGQELDRLTLVILSAVNYADKGNLDAVSDALKAQRAAIAKATGTNDPSTEGGRE